MIWQRKHQNSSICDIVHDLYMYCIFHALRGSPPGVALCTLGGVGAEESGTSTQGRALLIHGVGGGKLVCPVLGLGLVRSQGRTVTATPSTWTRALSTRNVLVGCQQL